jgi:biotin operon repressor
MKKKTWTMEDLDKMTKLWDTKTSEELAKDLHCKQSAVISMAIKLRKAGIKLQRKRMNGYIDTLIKDFVKKYNK